MKLGLILEELKQRWNQEELIEHSPGDLMITMLSLEELIQGELNLGTMSIEIQKQGETTLEMQNPGEMKSAKLNPEEPIP